MDTYILVAVEKGVIYKVGNKISLLLPLLPFSSVERPRPLGFSSDATYTSFAQHAPLVGLTEPSGLIACGPMDGKDHHRARGQRRHGSICEEGSRGQGEDPR